jgi:hypothetical protein
MRPAMDGILGWTVGVYLKKSALRLADACGEIVRRVAAGTIGLRGNVKTGLDEMEMIVCGIVIIIIVMSLTAGIIQEQQKIPVKIMFLVLTVLG